MTLSLSQYLLRDFVVDQVDAMLLKLAPDRGLGLPPVRQVYFHLCLSGLAYVRLNDRGQAIELRPGQCALLLYGAAHGVCSARHSHAALVGRIGAPQENDELPVTAVGEGTVTRLLTGRLHLATPPTAAPSHRALPHLLVPPPPLFADPAPVLAACSGPGAQAYAYRLAELCVIHALRHVYNDFRQFMPVQLGDHEMSRIATVVRKMREHPERRWTVASLAREVGCSRSSFAAKFQAHAGMGPIRFAACTRLALAQSLLQSNPELPLWEVARRVGYDVQGSFTRAFKGQFGLSPRHFVQHLRDKARSAGTGR
jgi:AraC-like DNA-binding protein